MLPHIVPRLQLPFSGFQRLADEALAERYRFLDRLAADWENGGNRFAGSGESLFGATDDQGLIAVGGINRDPYADSPDIGRLRHFFVRIDQRRKGVGGSLLAAILDQAAPTFAEIRLRADNPAAARLYERYGFAQADDPSFTHVLVSAAIAAHPRTSQEPQWIA